MLTTPFTLPCGATLQNRLAKAALTERLCRADHLPNDDHERLYEAWAETGAGLMISGNIMIDRRHLESGGNIIADSEKVLPQMIRMTNAGKKSGHHFWAQINHSGRQTTVLVNRRPLAPSEVRLKKMGLFGRPKAMSEEDIEQVIRQFVRTAVLCKEGGFTGIQIHSAHGYLLSEFLSPRTNTRTDQWGGPLENRARLLLRIVRETRQAVGPGFPIGVKLNSADFQRGGFDEQDSLEVIRMLGEEGIDLLEISGGTYENIAFLVREEPGMKESTRQREAYFLDFARKVRLVSAIPLMVTGGFRTPAFAEQALQNGELDVVGMGRPFCSHPELIPAFLAGERMELPNYSIRTGISRLDDSAEAGYYARLIIRLAKGKKRHLDYSGLRSAFFLIGWEMRKALERAVSFRRE